MAQAHQDNGTTTLFTALNFRRTVRRRLKRGVFHSGVSVVDPKAAINPCLAGHNRQPKPFV
jgi:hypothetical protein